MRKVNGVSQVNTNLISETNNILLSKLIERKIIKCPNCGDNNLINTHDKLRCSQCNSLFWKRNNAVYFLHYHADINENNLNHEAAIRDLLSGINEQVFTLEEYLSIFEISGLTPTFVRVDGGSLKAILKLK